MIQNLRLQFVTMVDRIRNSFSITFGVNDEGTTVLTLMGNRDKSSYENVISRMQNITEVFSSYTADDDTDVFTIAPDADNNSLFKTIVTFLASVSFYYASTNLGSHFFVYSSAAVPATENIQLIGNIVSTEDDQVLIVVTMIPFRGQEDPGMLDSIRINGEELGYTDLAVMDPNQVVLVAPHGSQFRATSDLINICTEYNYLYRGEVMGNLMFRSNFRFFPAV